MLPKFGKYEENYSALKQDQPFSNDTSFGIKETSSCISKHGWRASFSFNIPDPTENVQMKHFTFLHSQRLDVQLWFLN